MTFMENVMRSRKDVKEKGLNTSMVLENPTALTLGYILMDMGRRAGSTGAGDAAASPLFTGRKKKAQLLTTTRIALIAA